jgi:hypothetical protein
VPTNFLSPAQISLSAPCNADPSPEDLTEFFHLKDTDQPLLETCRLNHTKPGKALYLKYPLSSTISCQGVYVAGLTHVGLKCRFQG